MSGRVKLPLQAVFFIIAVLSILHFFRGLDIKTSTWIMLAALALGGWQLLRKSVYKSISSSGHSTSVYVFVAINLIGIISTAITYHNMVILRVPISLLYSDIIPQIQTMSARFLYGDFPYEVIDFGWCMQPTYMPMQWLPYTVADIFSFDPRWISFSLFSLGCLATGYQLSKRTGPWAVGILTLLPYLGLLYILIKDAWMLGMTVEIGIAGYYMLLIAALLSGKWYWKALTIGVCLLSRYSLVFWVPLFFLVEYGYYGWKTVFKEAVVIAAMFLMLYGPFLLQDPTIFQKGYTYHSNAALGEWSRGSDHPSGKPAHFIDGIGLATYFIEIYPEDRKASLQLLQKIHALSSLGISLLLGLIFWLRRHRINNPEAYLAGGLLLYFVLFYGFIQIPYGYLFVVPAFSIYATLPALSKGSFRQG